MVSGGRRAQTALRWGAVAAGLFASLFAARSPTLLVALHVLTSLDDAKDERDERNHQQYEIDRRRGEILLRQQFEPRVTRARPKGNCSIGTACDARWEGAEVRFVEAPVIDRALKMVRNLLVNDPTRFERAPPGVSNALKGPNAESDNKAEYSDHWYEQCWVRAWSGPRSCDRLGSHVYGATLLSEGNSGGTPRLKCGADMLSARGRAGSPKRDPHLALKDAGA